MAKLVDLLAKYLVQWPEGAQYARQDADKEVCFDSKIGMGISTKWDFFLDVMAEDANVINGVGWNYVYPEDWLSARDRLHAETLKEMIQVGGAIEALDYDADQALWDKVAVQAIPAFLATSQEWTSDEEASAPMESWSDIAKGAAQLADAFMAERAKRLKGGV